MNKMAKGAIATGLGVALLIGGGGTLAVWNAEQVTNAGRIAAGDLNVKQAPGIWTSNLSPDPTAPIDLKNHAIVPGEKLTYRQTLDVTLEGEHVEAKLNVRNGARVVNSTFDEGTFAVTSTATVDGTPIGTDLVLDGNKVIQAEATFEFLASTKNRKSVNKQYTFGDVVFTLDQIDPTRAANN